jgi:hypothetical protein
VEILQHGMPADSHGAQPCCSRAAQVKAVRSFHRKRAVVEKMTVQAVHALDASHLLLQLAFDRDAVVPLLALYNWKSARVLCIHPLHGRRALACIMWCALDTFPVSKLRCHGIVITLLPEGKARND